MKGTLTNKQHKHFTFFHLFIVENNPILNICAWQKYVDYLKENFESDV